MDGESFIPLKCSFERLELFSESLQVLLGELPYLSIAEAIRILWFHGRSWWHASAKLD